MKKILLSLLLTALTQNIWSSSVSLAEIGQITGVYRRGKSLIVTLETNLKLPTGLVVYIDENRKIPAILKDHYKSTETTLIYEATVAKQVDISEGEKVFIEGEIRGQGADVYIKLDRRAIFLPKSGGQVLASYGSRVHIDRGSLHEVRERDIYAIYDSSGKYKGKIETRGIGDHQSIGQLYSGAKKEVEPGDTVKFLGQRKFFGLGVAAAAGVVQDQTPSGGGLLFWWTFPNGWGINWLWGTWFFEHFETDNRYIFNVNMPAVFRKNFFYPNWISPYAGVCIASYSSWAYVGIMDSTSAYGAGIYPVLGVELFQTQLFHVHLEGIYLTTPELEINDKKFKYEGWGYSVAVTTNW